ncbi:MAG: hypothetical protein B6U95_00065 [Thermofilum sp. ex4484_82]|nr:MAG: hypothetical protein B6U95_00065 [Thermofilum sp. ex4484_82]OYT40124.1 MAG: hypothetical protein B6U96_00065 [Archaeoglobales archaeon ex4484_92]
MLVKATHRKYDSVVKSLFHEFLRETQEIISQLSEQIARVMKWGWENARHVAPVLQGRLLVLMEVHEDLKKIVSLRNLEEKIEEYVETLRRKKEKLKKNLPKKDSVNFQMFSAMIHELNDVISYLEIIFRR